MITGKDFYDAVASVVPLYVAMILAYGSVRWWKIFTPEQCSGISRFVAVFAVPLLSFHFISTNDPYAMNFRFLAADSLQKVVVLAALFLWKIFVKSASLDWMITFFSLSTLPNTLVMGIPLLKAMYGESYASLMVQIVVLQSVIWYTLILFMFEYRAATLLIADQFPEKAASIASVRVDSDVISLSGRELLQADAEVGYDGKLHVVVRRSNATSSSALSSNHKRSQPPRLSNLSEVEIYSVQSTPRVSSFNQTDDYYGMFPNKTRHGYTNSFGGDVLPLELSKDATRRTSNFEEEMLRIANKWMGRRSMSGEVFAGTEMQIPNTSYPPGSNSDTMKKQGVNSENNHYKGNTKHMVNKATSTHSGVGDSTRANIQQEIATSKENASPAPRFSTNGSPFRYSKRVYDEEQEIDGQNKKTQTPPASVMTSLVLMMVWRKLIRNPNTYASLIGIAWSLISFRFHIKMPKIVSGSISILSDTGLGTATFALGFFLGLQPKLIPCGKRMAIFAMAVKFLVGPVIIIVTSIALGLRGDLLRVAIVQASLSQGIVPFVFAREYNVHADIASTSVIFGMVVALPVAIIYYIILGVL